MTQQIRLSSMAGIIACLLLSGFSCLVYEVTWAKLVGQWLGVSIHGVALITAIFMGGLGVGALIAGVLADKRHWQVLHALRAFGACQVAASFGALVIPWGIREAAAPALAAAGHGSYEFGYIIRALSAVLLLSPPVVLLGASFSAISRAVLNHPNSEKVVGWFYAVNTFGACIGVVCTGFYLLPHFGISATSAIAAALNALAGLGALALSIAGRSNLEAAKEKPKPERRERPEPIIVGKDFQWLCAIAAAAGGLSLALEVIWTRWFALVLTSSVYSFTLVLSVVLLAVAVGNAVAAKVAKRGNATLLAFAALFVASCYLLLILYFADEVVWSFISLQQALLPLSGSIFAAGLMARAIVVFVCCFVPSVCIGSVFTLLVESAGVREEDAAQRVGKLYAASSIGGFIGTILTAFFLIPNLSVVTTSGIQSSLILSVILLALLAISCFWTWTKVHSSDQGTAMVVTGAAGFVVVGIMLDLLLFPPTWNKKLMSSGASFFAAADLSKLDRESFFNAVAREIPGRDELIFYREGLNSTVTVSRNKSHNIVYLRNDGKVEAAVPVDRDLPSAGADVKTQLALGFVPLLMYAHQPADVLLVGYGSGTTASVIASFPTVKKVTVCELESAVIAANSFFRNANRDVLLKPSVKVVSADARYVLMSSPQTYDLIVSQPADPWLPGSSNLFTKEFWETSKHKLNDDGLLCQWVQLYSIAPEHLIILCKTFQSVFPNCYIVQPEGAGEILLVGINGDKVANSTTIQQRMQQPEFKEFLRAAGCETPDQLKLWTLKEPKSMDEFIRRNESAGSVAMNTDDRLLTEYALPQLLAEPEKFLERNIGLIRANK